MTRFPTTALSIFVLLAGSSALALDKDEELERLAAAASVVSEVLDMPEALPKDLLDKAECIVVLPSVKKFAIGIGGSYGKGAMVCRAGHAFDGPWGAPAMYRLEGANIGLQIGGQATDFIFLVMNKKGADSLLRSKVKLGADVSAAAGPKGRAAGASTDAYMSAEILTYSRTRGLFAGASLEGSTLRPDAGASEDLYGKEMSARDIVRREKDIPEGAWALVEILRKASPENLSE